MKRAALLALALTACSSPTAPRCSTPADYTWSTLYLTNNGVVYDSLLVGVCIARAG